MKRLISVLLTCLIPITLLTGCGRPSQELTEIHIFAAASLQETLTALGDPYMAENSDVVLIFNFDSSGTLKTQIEEGAQCDIFISAGQNQMDQLSCVLQDSRFNILENKVALAVPEGNPAGIHSFDDLANGLMDGSLLLAMGNADVPVGQYTRKILTHFKLDETALARTGCITYGSNVKEVTAQICEVVVDCGIIYQTDAFSAGLTVVDTATAEMCGQVVYPAAILKTSQNQDPAREFLDFLTSDTADAVFEKVGFTPIS